MSIYIDSHKAVLKQVGDIFLDMYSPLPNHHLNQFNPSDGDGYSEIYDFGKLCVGKGQILGRTTFENERRISEQHFWNHDSSFRHTPH